jgi:hypothetical protein
VGSGSCKVARRILRGAGWEGGSRAKARTARDRMAGEGSRSGDR